MKIIDIVNGPWAITPEMLNEIRSIYAKHLRGEKINIKDIEAQTGKTLQKKEQGYEVINNTAVIPIEGVIAKKMNLFSQISGGASTQLIERDIKNALDDPLVNKIILYIDSPGGTIDGTFELANFIFENRGKKPIIAFTDGAMFSAAFAIGAAADKVFISGDTAAVGSIGVVAAHEDISKLEEKIGIKTTEIYSGKYKRIASQYAPLSDEAKKTLQDEVDYLFSVFVNDVAKFRGTTTEDVLTRMSTNVKRYFIGKESISAGLVDGVSTLDKLINGDISAFAADNKPAGSAGNAVFNLTEKEEIMTLAELKEKHPDMAAELIAEGVQQAKTEMSDAIEKAKKEGAESERTRIKSVKEQLMPGHEALIESLMFDGETTGDQAASKVLAAEKTLRESKLKAFEAEGEKIKVPVVEGADDAANTMKRKEFDALSADEKNTFLKSGGKIID